MAPRIPWNREKSVAGSAALVIAGGAAGAFLCWWCRPVIIPPPYLWFSLAAPIAAALVAAAVETIPIRLDDNLSVPLTRGRGCGRCRSSARICVVATVSTLPAALLVCALPVKRCVAAAGYRGPHRIDVGRRRRSGHRHADLRQRRLAGMGAAAC